MTLFCENLILELIAWNSFALSMFLLSFLLLYSENCKTGCIIIHTWIQGRLELSLQLSHTNTLTVMILLSVPFSVVVHFYPYCYALGQPYIIINAFFRTMLLFVFKISFVFEVL